MVCYDPQEGYKSVDSVHGEVFHLWKHGIYATGLPFTLPIPGNDSKVDGLVNFEKLRMIAKEIRHVGRMASVNMDPALMFRTR